MRGVPAPGPAAAAMRAAARGRAARCWASSGPGPGSPWPAQSRINRGSSGAWHAGLQARRSPGQVASPGAGAVGSVSAPSSGVGVLHIRVARSAGGVTGGVRRDGRRGKRLPGLLAGVPPPRQWPAVHRCRPPVGGCRSGRSGPGGTGRARHAPRPPGQGGRAPAPAPDAGAPGTISGALQETGPLPGAAPGERALRVPAARGGADRYRPDRTVADHGPGHRRRPHRPRQRRGGREGLAELGAF